jgi:hypothetical protein
MFNVSFNSSVSNFSIDVYNNILDPLSGQISTNGTISLKFEPRPLAKTYYFRISSFIYDVYYDISINQVLTLVDDNIEEYDDFQHGYQINNMNWSRNELVQFDPDYYRLSVSPGYELSIFVKCPDGAPIRLVDVVPNDNHLVREDLSTNDGKLGFTFAVNNNTNVYVIAILGDNVGTPYDLTINFTYLGATNINTTIPTNNTNPTNTTNENQTQASDNNGTGTLPFEMPFGDIPGYPIVTLSCFSCFILISIIIHIKRFRR